MILIKGLVSYQRGNCRRCRNIDFGGSLSIKGARQKRNINTGPAVLEFLQLHLCDHMVIMRLGSGFSNLRGAVTRPAILELDVPIGSYAEHNT